MSDYAAFEDLSVRIKPRTSGLTAAIRRAQRHPFAGWGECAWTAPDLLPGPFAVVGRASAGAAPLLGATFARAAVEAAQHAQSRTAASARADIATATEVANRVYRDLRETRKRLGVKPGDSLMLHEFGVELLAGEADDWQSA